MHHHRIRAFAVLLFGVILIVVVAHMGRLPGAPNTPPPTTVQQAAADPGCQATQVATDGTPPPGTPQLDPQKLCDALNQAEQDAACMGDYQPPNQDLVNARQFCLDLHQRGCGNPFQDCGRIPQDQTYYTHH